MSGPLPAVPPRIPPASGSNPPHPTFPLLSLPDPILLRILHHLSHPPHTPLRPALTLAQCSVRLHRLFKHGILCTLNPVPDGRYLDPLPRCDARFRARDPHRLRRIIAVARDALLSLHLPLYDCSMEDAQWSVLAAVARHCPNLSTLVFVDSLHHTCTTPPPDQCRILARLLPSLTSLTLYCVREPAKLHTIASVQAFCPRVLVLHQIHPTLHPHVIRLLINQGPSIRSLTLSFQHVPPEYKTQLSDFCLPFLAALSNTIAQAMPLLTHLHVLAAPRTNPLTALPGPSVSPHASRLEFDNVSNAIHHAKATTTTKTTTTPSPPSSSSSSSLSPSSPPPQPHPLHRLVLDRLSPQLATAIRLFSPHCDSQTEIEVFLHEVLLVSPAAKDEPSLPYFRATKLHSSSWMIRDLSPSYFRHVQHIHVGLDEDCSKSSRPWYDRMLSNGRTSGNPDMQSFRFLCEQSGSEVESVFATVPTESAEKANAVLRVLSSGFAYARNVSFLALSGDTLRYFGMDHSLLYSVVGQLKNLREIHVSEPTPGSNDGNAKMENCPVSVLIKGLWMFCHKLQSFKLEFSSFASACSVQSLRSILEALRELDRKLPGVETHGLAELVEISLKHSCEEANGFGNRLL